MSKSYVEKMYKNEFIVKALQVQKFEVRVIMEAQETERVI